MNYVKYLEGLGMIGPFYPWKKDAEEYIKALLVSVDIALAECNAWSNQSMTKGEFLSYLKVEDILVLHNVEDFVKWKKDQAKPSGKKKFTRNISEERRNQLRNHAKQMREKIRPTNS